MNCAYSPYQIQATSPQAATGADFLEVMIFFFWVWKLKVNIEILITY